MGLTANSKLCASHEARQTLNAQNAECPAPTPSPPPTLAGHRDVMTRSGTLRGAETREPVRRCAERSKARPTLRLGARCPLLNLLAVAVPAHTSQSAWSHVTASWLCGLGRGQAAPGGSAWGASPSCLDAPGGELGTPHSEYNHQQGDAAASATSAESLRSCGKAARDVWSRTFTVSQNQGCAPGAVSIATRGSPTEFC
ncbi:hypothetical protein NN561_014692 [Cricetulus griseus]